MCLVDKNGVEITVGSYVLDANGVVHQVLTLIKNGSDLLRASEVQVVPVPASGFDPVSLDIVWGS